MQTFLPFADFQASARSLDRARLGKQRVECKQIVLALEAKARGERAGWQNHPAVRMWEGFIPCLCEYALAVCLEWQRRGYLDNLAGFFEERTTKAVCQRPPWLGREDVHASHRARLLQKSPDHYRAQGWTETPCGPEGYVWPKQLQLGLNGLTEP